MNSEDLSGSGSLQKARTKRLSKLEPRLRTGSASMDLVGF